MMLAVLLLLTVSVLVVPLLPALREWRRPRDVVPLPIDEADALDPPHLAHSFSALLADAVGTGATHLGGSSITYLVLGEGSVGLPLRPAEIQSGRSDRLWHIDGGVQLPENIHFYAEVSASGGLRTAADGVYRALWAGATATLEPGTTVLRWAHGQEVHIGNGCHATGRVTAEKTVTVAQGVDFMLLHAPQVLFVGHDGRFPGRPQVGAALCLAITEWPTGVVWDGLVRRAFARLALRVDAYRSWRADIVCLADLVLGEYCQATGSLKARGALHVGAGSHISGSVVAGGAIHLGAGCNVHGSLVSETAIVVGPGCTIGTPHQSATVAAPWVRISAGTTVYGTIWAEEKGETTQPAGADADGIARADLSTYGAVV
ncbi:hypothetical protein [Rhodoferax sp. WC2427]|uniref:hypothetical protein n=1 Tax=Rhodoferax sp. WC2427 TaxID=3234144 RepID=UPI0034655F8A